MAGTVLLERDELLEELASAGVGRLVFVGGEAGVGKTSLVRAFCERTDKRVLHGICEALTTPTALGPFVDLVGQVGGGFGAKVAAGAAPREVALALAAELDRPSVVVLEDVHWADEASLDVLRVLGRRVDGTKALVLATYRHELSDDHPLRVVLGELASTAAITRCTVEPLSLGGRADALRCAGGRRRVDLRPHARQPVLRHRGARGGRYRASPDGARRGARAGGLARPRRAPPARRRRSRSCTRRALAARDGRVRGHGRSRRVHLGGDAARGSPLQSRPSARSLVTRGPTASTCACAWEFTRASRRCPRSAS